MKAIDIGKPVRITNYQQSDADNFDFSGETGIVVAGPTHRSQQYLIKMDNEEAAKACCSVKINGEDKTNGIGIFYPSEVEAI